MKVNVTQEEADRLLKLFPGECLTQEEEEEVDSYFRHYMFYESHGGRKRTCRCSACGERLAINLQPHEMFFGHYLDNDSELRRTKHGDSVFCPACMENVTMVAAGRIRSGATLYEDHKVLRINRASDGALLIQSGIAVRGYNNLDETWFPGIDFGARVLYYIRPGKIACWKKEYSFFPKENKWKGHWELKKTAVKPFAGEMHAGQPSYITIGADKIEQTDMRYCCLGQWMELGEGRNVTEFLAQSAMRPQLELLIKMGMHDFVKDMVAGESDRHLNWKGRSPAAFFRMSKQQAAKFVAGECNMADYRMIKGLREYDVGTVIEIVKSCGRNTADRLYKAGREYGLDMDKTYRYLRKQGSADRRLPAQEYMDYLRMANDLHMDLTQEVVRYPKNITEAHDNAVALRNAIHAELADKTYKARKRKLEKKYAFVYGGLAIVVPQSGQEIVDEGQKLQHCVGGYANRHLKGKTVILFLRDIKTINTPLVTIEMTGVYWDKIQQIHGFRNEGRRLPDGSYPEDPKTKYKEFLDVWLAWVRAGSKRTRAGEPIIRVNEEGKTA